MSESLRSLYATALLAALVLAAYADPPRVVEATPDYGDVGVDPAMVELTITFDQDMNSGGRSICGGGASFPEITGTPTWKDKRTLVVPVKLKHGMTYHLSINCPAAQNFRSAKGEPAIAYPISFKTLADGAAAPRPPTKEENLASFAALRTLIDEQYSYRDLRRVDWSKAYREFEPRFVAAVSTPAFARLAAKLLEPAGDIHNTVRYDEFTFATARRAVPVNANFQRLQALVSDWKRHNDTVATGRIGEFAYINIFEWTSNSDAYAAAQKALDGAADAKGVILDVRFNSGGDELAARAVAARFIDAPAVYSKNRYRDLNAPDGFGKTHDRTIDPAPAEKRVRARVAVLMGPYNMSSCESFLLMMRQSPRAALIGEKSYGSSGRPIPHPLPNGVVVVLSSWQDLLPDGKVLEGVGVEPDLRVAARPSDFDAADPVMDAALRWLREERGAP